MLHVSLLVLNRFKSSLLLSFFGKFLASIGLTIQNLFIFTAAGVVPCGGRESF